MPDHSLEAKICVLGAQGVGKTSLVQRYVSGTFTAPNTRSTVGASFQTKRTQDLDSGVPVRLQIWDTAGTERFRSISRLYYRGASAVILVYSIIDQRSFDEMLRWLDEVQDQLGGDTVIHVVGSKSDLVAQQPHLRAVPFERCIARVAERLHPALAATPPPSAGAMSSTPGPGPPSSGFAEAQHRSSGFWVQDVGWDDCHEISASSGEGIDEVFRVVTRKLVEKRMGPASTAGSGAPSAAQHGQPALRLVGAGAGAGTGITASNAAATAAAAAASTFSLSRCYAMPVLDPAARGYFDGAIPGQTSLVNHPRPPMAGTRPSWFRLPLPLSLLTPMATPLLSGGHGTGTGTENEARSVDIGHEGKLAVAGRCC